nr:hypothetical protein [Tanacetum cinerariifolium]
MMFQGMRKVIQTKGIISDSIHFDALGDMQEFVKMLVSIVTRQTMKLARILDLLNHVILESKVRFLNIRQTSTASTTIADNVPIPTNSSSHATNILITSQDVDELNPNAMIDGNTFINHFVTSSSNAAETSSSQNVDPSNMHTFYQPYPYEFQWTKDHPLEQVIGEPSRPVLTRNQLRSDGDMCMYALTVSIMKLKNVKEAMIDPVWIKSMQEELL